MTHLVLGATGHVGSAVVDTLIANGQSVVAVIRDAGKADQFLEKGIKVAIADAHNVEELRQAFAQGDRLFILNPPADPSTDTVKEETQTINNIIEALTASSVEKVVALSTYGAQPGDRLGDLGVLYHMEQLLSGLDKPTTILRGAYFMSNWESALAEAKTDGLLHSFYPADFKLPMIAPQDLGLIAAHLLMEPVNSTRLYHAQGPSHYSPADVAHAFAKALGHSVDCIEIPEVNWKNAMISAGFSAIAAESMSAMTKATLEAKMQPDPQALRTATTLEDYIGNMVRKDNQDGSTSLSILG